MSLIMAAAPGTPFYLDSSFWVAVPLILFLAFVINKGALKAINASLDKRAEDIKNDLDEARRLREEAQTLLASYNRKQKGAEEQAEAIIEQAKHDAELMAANARKDLSERLERRAAQAEAKIAAAEAQAMAEVKAKAADMALEAAEKVLRSNLKATDHSALVKDGIAQMGKVLN
jgi:F-type H+-transporting ATPase subunit b